MIKHAFIAHNTNRLALRHRPSSLDKSNHQCRVGNAQPFLSRIKTGQSHSPTSWYAAFKTKIDASVAGTGPTDDALSP